MLRHYGPQQWWPGDTCFEIMAGAVLTQATSWTNAAKAISNLKVVDALTPRAIRSLSHKKLAALIYPCGYYNSKAQKLKALAEYLGQRFNDDLKAMSDEKIDVLRPQLLEVYGIGEETADDILLYALGKSAFVVDSYTKRLFFRLGLAPEKASYSTYIGMVHTDLPSSPELFNEYHGLIVHHCKEVCRKEPLCQTCCLVEVCPTGKTMTSTP